MKFRFLAWMAAMVLAVGVVGGCKDKSGTARPPRESGTTGAVAVAGEQTVCPVMDGNPINKDIFVEYQGKKVYFCCAECKDKFNAAPDKYLSKLPQFQKAAEDAAKAVEDAAKKTGEAAKDTADAAKKAAEDAAKQLSLPK